jgi:hypothetical protein
LRKKDGGEEIILIIITDYKKLPTSNQTAFHFGSPALLAKTVVFQIASFLNSAKETHN